MRGDKEARVRHDPITLCHLNHSCSGGAPLLRHRSPASGCRAKGEGVSLCPLHWDAPPAPTGPLYLRSVLDRDVLGILSHPGPVQDNGGDLGVPGKLQLPHWGSTRYPSGGCPTCPGSVIYRPAPRLAAGREEERRFPVAARTAALKISVGVPGHSNTQEVHAGAPQGRQHTHAAAPGFATEVPASVYEVSLSCLLGSKHSPFLPAVG